VESECARGNVKRCGFVTEGEDLPRGHKGVNWGGCTCIGDGGRSGSGDVEDELVTPREEVGGVAARGEEVMFMLGSAPHTMTLRAWGTVGVCG